MSRVALRRYADHLMVSLWFIPLVMALAGVLLAWTWSLYDQRVDSVPAAHSVLVYSGNVDEARALLVSIAATTLTTAGIVFTLLTLPLSTVATQYGSRLLRLFIADHTAQLVLGMFTGTFCYCIAGALSILPAEAQPANYHITATFGIYLMLVSFGSLLLLIHHISTTLQAPNIVVAAGKELRSVIRAEAAVIGSGAARKRAASEEQVTAQEDYAINAYGVGYLQSVDIEYILELTKQRDITLRLLRKPGHFVTESTVIAVASPASRMDEKLARKLQRSCRIGNLRTPTQDVEYAVNQLTEVGMRAMSPAINDPFTAMTCLDHLGVGLALFVEGGERHSTIYDSDGRLRIVFDPVQLSQLLTAGFEMLRHASRDNANVMLHMLDTFYVIGRATKAEDALRDLVAQVELVRAENATSALIPADKALIDQRCTELRTLFEPSAAA